MNIDLSRPSAPAANLLDGLPRRVSLTLPELRALAEAAGAPLPFSEPDIATPDPLSSRLGATPAAHGDPAALIEALAQLHPAAETLRRRGLLDDGVLDPQLHAALGLLASPRHAVDLELSVPGGSLVAWHRVRDGVVAALATADGVVFELSWLPLGDWTGELTRTVALPADLTLSESALPSTLSAPYVVADAAAEAHAAVRPELMGGIVAGADVLADGVPLDEAAAIATLTALHTECRGRLRVLGTDVEASGAVGVVAWTLLADGWHSLSTRSQHDTDTVVVTRVEPGALAGMLAPMLAEVAR